MFTTIAPRSMQYGFSVYTYLPVHGQSSPVQSWIIRLSILAYIEPFFQKYRVPVYPNQGAMCMDSGVMHVQAAARGQTCLYGYLTVRICLMLLVPV